VQRNKKAKNFLPNPIYPGGNKVLKQFISETLTYPTEALKAKIEGVVRIKIAINFKGNVVDTQIMSHLDHGCDEEADRIARLMQWEIDKKIRKGKVLFHKTLNIHFKLPNSPKATAKKKIEKKALPIEITYNIVSPSKPSSTPKSGTITYTIKY
jgi:TonB family protein